MTEETKLQVTASVGRNKDKEKDEEMVFLVVAAVQGQQPAGANRQSLGERLTRLLTGPLSRKQPNFTPNIL